MKHQTHQTVQSNHLTSSSSSSSSSSFLTFYSESRTHSIFKNLSAASISISIVFLIGYLHLISLYIYSNGFLLHRSILNNQSNHSSHQSIIQPSHSKSIIILIDALRFDFLESTTTQLSSSYSSNSSQLLSLPNRLSQQKPLNSKLYHFLADPPTTTLQRLKGLTTGTLPTFIDLGSNFDSSHSFIQEDSWLNQLSKSKKVIGFTGDDTWINLFGIKQDHDHGLFDSDLSHGFESFNVEDLDTVDQGVEDHFHQILSINSNSTQNQKHWDVMIGHFLGLDHAGHRFGPGHPSITSKLKQYDRFLEKIVDSLDDDTLLVVMGDHGMDPKGDHGGDSFLEVSTALWLYSKSRALMDSDQSLPDWVLDQEVDFIMAHQDSDLKSRTVSQIDLVPTLSLLLGLPIPFSNLGMIIPELFYRSTLLVDSELQKSGHRKPPKVLTAAETLLLSTQINSHQLSTFLETYAGSPNSPGHDLSGYVPELRTLYDRARELHHQGAYPQAFRAYRAFGSSLLSRSRKIWARFVPSLMVIGITILGLSLLVSLKILDYIKYTTEGSQAPIRSLLGAGFEMGLLGTLAGLFIYPVKVYPAMGLVTHILCGSAIGLSFGIILHQNPLVPGRKLIVGNVTWFKLIKLTPMILHALALGSNSYTVWEDRVVVYLISITVLLPVMISSFSAPQKRLRNRLIGFSLLFGLCVRLISTSTVCREEQSRFCSVTFYGDSISSSAPNWVMGLLIPLAISLPIALAWFLGISDSYRGPASIYFGSGFRFSLLCGVQYWISDFIISQGDLSINPNLKLTGTWIKTLVARVDFGICLVAAGALWYVLPLCIDVERQQEAEEESNDLVVKGSNDDNQAESITKKNKPRVLVIGFANSYGSSYLMYLSAGFGILFLVNQPMGQLTISIGLIAILSLIEIHDSLNDVKALDHSFQSAINAAASGQSISSSPGVGEGASSLMMMNKEGKLIKDRSRRRIDFLTISGLSLLSYIIFFGTGHQATIGSIQWKTGFIGLRSAHQFWSAILILLNSLGGFILISLSVPLIGTWNQSPIINLGNSRGSSKSKTKSMRLNSDVIEIGLKLMNYHCFLGLSSMICCTILRRHLMVWKIFAPRFILASLIILINDFFIVVFSISWGFNLLILKIKRTFGTQSV